MAPLSAKFFTYFLVILHCSLGMQFPQRFRTYPFLQKQPGTQRVTQPRGGLRRLSQVSGQDGPHAVYSSFLLEHPVYVLSVKNTNLLYDTIDI